jgi:hypothetical protein
MRTVMPACLALLVTASAVQAQDSFANLKPGGLPTLYVTDRAGYETRGKLVRLTDASVTIAVDGADRTFEIADVSLVERRGDSLKNGAIAGMVLGMGVGALSMGIADCPSGETHCTGTRVAGFALSTAIYTAIGTAIDAAVSGRTRIWPITAKAAGAPVASVSPRERRLFVGWRISR